MRFLRRVVSFLASLGAIVVVLLLIAGCCLQDRLIYHPRPYRPLQIVGSGEITKRVQPLAYTTSQGPQQCYYVAATSGDAKGSVWVTFCGNGSLALEWLPMLNSYPAGKDAFLLIDYPSYGACAGHPTPETIQESANAALAALAGHLGVKVEDLEPHLNTLGHSLGAANALGFASKHQVSRVVLIAPFTSLRDMARLTVGRPICYLLRHNYDNRARMREITSRSNVPDIEIFSGTQDEVIPFTMGQELGGISPAVHFEAVEGAGHNTILDLAHAQIFAAMEAKESKKPEVLPAFQ